MSAVLDLRSDQTPSPNQIAQFVVTLDAVDGFEDNVLILVEGELNAVGVEYDLVTGLRKEEVGILLKVVVSKTLLCLILIQSFVVNDLQLFGVRGEFGDTLEVASRNQKKVVLDAERTNAVGPIHLAILVHFNALVVFEHKA